MKKIFLLLISLLLICGISYAENDITFHGIPWLSDEVKTIDMLEEANLLREWEGRILSIEESSYLVHNETGFIFPSRKTDLTEVSFTVDLLGYVKGKIAGYPVEDLILTFAYDGEYKLIAVKVELINDVYDDLKVKLINVYGEAEEKITEEGIMSTVWQQGNTAVVLYTESEGLDFMLVYGRTDAEEILEKCLRSNGFDDVSGL